MSSNTIFQRVAAVAQFDGWGLVIFGALSVLTGLWYRDLTGLLIGTGLTTLGGIELHGRRLWLAGNTRATGWLAGSQIGTLLLLVSYAVKSYRHPPFWRIEQLSRDARTLLEAMPNYDRELIDEMFPLILRIAFLILILVVLAYQGGMAFYYLRASRKLGERPPPLP